MGLATFLRSGSDRSRQHMVERRGKGGVATRRMEEAHICRNVWSRISRQMLRILASRPSCVAKVGAAPLRAPSIVGYYTPIHATEGADLRRACAGRDAGKQETSRAVSAPRDL